MDDEETEYVGVTYWANRGGEGGRPVALLLPYDGEPTVIDWPVDFRGKQEVCWKYLGNEFRTVYDQIVRRFAFLCGPQTREINYPATQLWNLLHGNICRNQMPQHGEVVLPKCDEMEEGVAVVQALEASTKI